MILVDANKNVEGADYINASRIEVNLYRYYSTEWVVALKLI